MNICVDDVFLLFFEVVVVSVLCVFDGFVVVVFGGISFVYMFNDMI